MKRFIISISCLFIALGAFGQAKYVFVFIGDGMGANAINFTQFYNGALNGRIGTDPLCLGTFPVCNVATTFSLNKPVTDSAASGTAIACGQKTNNGMLGMTPDGTEHTTIAELAKQNGKKVAIVTTVGANHATPAAFFGHQESRNNYDELMYDMIDAGFDFYAGSTLLRSKKQTVENPAALFKDAGYTIIGNNEEFQANCKDAEKILFIPDSNHSIRFAIDRKIPGNYITLKDYVQSAVEFMMKDKCKKGFFIMAEGGEVDHCTHGNDARAAIDEIKDMDDAIMYAYQFYLQHPKETMILVTADHDTGAPALNLKDAKHLASLQYQKYSVGTLTEMLKQKMKAKGTVPMTWEEIKDFFRENMGLWDSVNMNAEREERLRKVYDNTIAINKTGDVTDDFGYNHNAVIVAEAVNMLDEYAGITWGTRSHSSAYVPVYYIGPEVELFATPMDNTSFYDKIAEVARYKR